MFQVSLPMTPSYRGYLLDLLQFCTILQVPDSEHQFAVEVITSDIAVGAVLSQWVAETPMCLFLGPCFRTANTTPEEMGGCWGMAAAPKKATVKGQCCTWEDYRINQKHPARLQAISLPPWGTVESMENTRVHKRLIAVAIYYSIFRIRNVSDIKVIWGQFGPLVDSAYRHPALVY